MNTQNTLNLIEISDFAMLHHANQYRDDGQSVFGGHISPVARMISKATIRLPYCEESTAIAYCHDLLEDTGCTEQELLARTNDAVLTGVCWLTNPKYCESDMDYAIRMSKMPKSAAIVKIADRLNNLESAIMTIEWSSSRVRAYARKAAIIYNCIEPRFRDEIDNDANLRSLFHRFNRLLEILS